MTLETCSAPGCERPANRKAAVLCEMHFYRLRRTGELERNPPRGEYRGSNGYTWKRCKEDHPLSEGNAYRYVYAHRLVLWDKLNGEQPICHWCGKALNWKTLHTDHLDDNKKNNDPANVVPACPTCNQKRGFWKMKQTVRRKARKLTAFGQTLAIVEWAEKVGIGRRTIEDRLQKGLTPEQALDPMRRGPRGRRV